MKLLQISLLILLPFSLLSQKSNKFEIADSILNVNEILKDEFGDEIMTQIEQMASMGGEYSFGVLELDNILEKEKNQEMEKMPGGCQCQMIMGKLEIANAVGFMAGTGSTIEINIADSTYTSKIFYYTDGMKIHKLNPDDEFIQDIEVLLEESKLEISPDSKFEHNGIIKGKLVGTSSKYYEQEYSDKGYKGIQTKVLSIFECKLQDYGQMMIEMKKLKELEEKKNKN